MKLKRFVAKDMKEALTLVKDELGADAIIMSNKRVAAGVEIVAGVENLPTALPYSNSDNTPSTPPAPQIPNRTPLPYMGRPVGNTSQRNNLALNNNNNDSAGGKNQAYAQSLIEILERQKTMSQEQGNKLMDDISKQINARNASRSNNMPGMRMPPSIENDDLSLSAIQKTKESQGGDRLKEEISSNSVDNNMLNQRKLAPMAPNPNLINPMTNLSQDKKSDNDSLKGTGVSRIINPSETKLKTADETDNDMSIDSNKKLSTATIDPSLDEDAELFKTPPLPLSQQREFKNFFVKSKVKQEKEDHENKAGINTYRSAGATEESVRKDLEQMRCEVENIRKLLQFELAGLLQDNRSRNEPVKAMIFKLLHSVGFSDSTADLLVRKLSQGMTFNNAWREMVRILENEILVGDDEIVSRGGIVTLIGPAGVGKTTTLAKLAARFVMRFGPQRVAIVTADHYRIGAVEQIKTYGRIMGCSTFAVKNLSELPQLLYNLSDKSLILVDTAGVGFKDERFNTQLKQLKLQSSLKLKHYLVLPCTTQRKVLQHAYDHFCVVGLAGLVLTKVDECQNLGDALSLSIEMKLPISYITDGQRVPEDLDVPHPGILSRRALAAVEDDAAQGALDDF